MIYVTYAFVGFRPVANVGVEIVFNKLADKS